MTQNLLEIPQQMREMAEKNVEQARVSYGQFMDAMTQAMAMWSKGNPSSEIASRFKVVQDCAVSFAKQNGEAGFSLASELAKAKRNAVSAESLCANPNANLHASGARARPDHVCGYTGHEALNGPRA